MSQPASIIVWNDAETTRPTHSGYFLVMVGPVGEEAPREAEYQRDANRWVDPIGDSPIGAVTYWAEPPVISDLSYANLRAAADATGEFVAMRRRWGLRGEPASERTLQALERTVDRLRAALGGKEEA